MIPRSATPDDAHALAALHAASFEAPWSCEEITVLLSGPGGFGLVVEDAAGGVCGFLLGRAIVDDAEILTLAVDPARRRVGLGRRLTDAAGAAALAAGSNVLFLEVAVDNAAALALYAAAGFQRAGYRPGYYRRPGGESVDALVLRRDLTA